MSNIGLCDNGNIALLRSGNIATCDACYGDIIDAIRERQKAVGATPLSTDYQYYCLDYLKSKVNNIAPSYIADNSWSGGADKPNTLSSSYADSADTCSKLFTLVKDMLKVRYNHGKPSTGTRAYSTDDLDDSASWSERKQDASSKWYNTTTEEPALPFERKILHNNDDKDYPSSATIRSVQAEFDVTLDTTLDLERKFVFYLRTTTDTNIWADVYTYDSQGRSGFIDGEFADIYNSGWVINDTESTLWPPSFSEPPNWPSIPSTEGESRIKGYNAQDDNDMAIILVEWNFTHT